MELNTILIIVGVVALFILILHGLWSNRREKSKHFQNEQTFSADARVGRGSDPSVVTGSSEMNVDLMMNTQSASAQAHSSAVNEPLQVTLPGYSATREPAQEPYTDPNTTLAQAEFFADLPIVETEKTQNDTPSNVDERFAVLHIVAAEGKNLLGPTLLQALDDLGFIFGEDKLFHYHLDLTVSSPIIFSVADIDKGIFEGHHSEYFRTVGISLFMRIPSAGNDRKNLKIMIHCAKLLAQRLNAFLLTEQQEIFDENAESAYLANL